MLRYLYLAFAVGLVFTGLAVVADENAKRATAREPGPYPPGQALENPIENNQASLAMGKRVYTRLCVTCHGADGKGETDNAEILDIEVSDLTDKEWKYGKTDGEIFTLIRDGAGNAMEAFKEKLPTHHIWHVVNYIRTLAPAEDGDSVAVQDDVPENPVPYSTASVARGKQFYARFCVKCHGMNGKGDTEMREFLGTHPSDLTNGEWKYGARDGDIFLVIKNGMEYDMEAFANRLSDERIWHVVNYLRSMGPEDQIPKGE